MNELSRQEKGMIESLLGEPDARGRGGHRRFYGEQKTFLKVLYRLAREKGGPNSVRQLIDKYGLEGTYSLYQK